MKNNDYNSPLISIIIPVYNASSFIMGLLSSVLNQTYKTLEIILVNDNSTDDSVILIERFIKSNSCSNSFILYNLEENRGASHARNFGLTKANGSYVFFMDSDDLLVNDCIEYHLSKLTEYNVDMSIGSFEIKGSNSIHHVSLKSDYFMDGDGIIRAFLNRKWAPSPWNKLIKKEILLKDNITFKEGIIYEDILWNFVLATYCKKAILFSRVTYIYIIQQNSVTTIGKGIKQINSYITVLQELSKYSESISYKNEYLSFLNFHKFNAALTVIKSELDRKNKKEFYGIINKINKDNITDIFSFFLAFPYDFFHLSLYLPYSMYKKCI